MRVCNANDNDCKVDIQFGQDEEDISLNSTLHYVLSKCIGIHPKRGENEMRVARIKLKNGAVDIKRDCWMDTSLGSIVNSSGIAQGDILEIASAVVREIVHSDTGNISE